MAVDAKIELFACELFSALWSEYPYGRVDFPFEIISDSDVPLESEMNNDILTAVKCLRSLYHSLLNTKFLIEFEEFCGSTCDFYAYLRKAFPSNESRKAPVMEVVLATCTFTLEMCIFSSSHGHDLFANKSHLVWAMYFDTELKPRFYAEGGWSALKRVAKSYILCYNFVTEHNNICTRKRGTSFSLWPVERNIAAIAEFMQFRGKEYLDKDVKLSTKFIYHCIADNNKPFPKTAVLSRNRTASNTFEGVEYLLQCMIVVCDRYMSNLIEYDRKIALGEVPRRVFYEPKTGKKFTVDEMQRKTLGSQYTKSHSDDASDQFESPIQEEKRIHVEKDCLEEIKSPTSSLSSPKANNLENHKSPFCAAFEDGLQKNLEFILSELDIKATSPENTILPNQYSPTIPGQRNILKPERKRLSAGEENSHSQIPLSQNLASKCMPSNEVLSPERKIENTAEKRKTSDKATGSLASSKPKIQTNSEKNKFLQESSTKVYQATKLGSVEPKISLNGATPTENKIITKQIDKIVSTLSKMQPTKGNFKTKLKVSEQTSNESKTSAEDRSESIKYHIKDILRMMLVLGSPPGIRFIRSTLHNSNKEKGKKTNKIFS